MKGRVWRDTTSYGRARRRDMVADQWQLDLPLVSLTVHRHVDDPERWFLTCRALDISLHRLTATEITAAQHEALVKLRTIARGVLDDLSRALAAERLVS